jgi:hypothetical protein
MKKILTLILVVITLSSFAQGRLGSTIDTIKANFSDQPFDSYQASNGERIYRTYCNGNECLYYINDAGYCDLFILYPKTSGVLNWYVEHYNGQYVVTDSKHWKQYVRNSDDVINISLEYDKKSDRDYFIHVTESHLKEMK